MIARSARTLHDVSDLTLEEQDLLILAVNHYRGVGPEATLDNLGFFTVDHAASCIRTVLIDRLLLLRCLDDLEATVAAIFRKFERA